MSEPLSSPEIEDVVSSVRRLVSTTHLPRVKTRDLAHDKLLLTPSLRVVPDPDVGPATVAADVAAAPLPPGAPEAALPAEALPAEPMPAEASLPEVTTEVMIEAPAAVVTAEAPIDAAVAVVPDADLSAPDPAASDYANVEFSAPEFSAPEFSAPEFSSDAAVPTFAVEAPPPGRDPEAIPEAPFVLVESVEAAHDGWLHDVEAEWEDELWTEAEAPLAEIAAEIEDAELVVALDPQLADDQMAEPLSAAWPEAGAEPETWAQSETDWVEEAPIPFVPLHHRAAAAEHQAALDEAAAVASDAPGTMLVEPAATAAAETVQAPTVTEPPVTEPTVTEPTVTEPTATEPTATEPTATEPTATEPVNPEPVNPEPALSDAASAMLAGLDEAALNDIVRNLIREELQGALGERITRNVRKLVRAEINRALAARAFE